MSLVQVVLLEQLMAYRSPFSQQCFASTVRNRLNVYQALTEPLITFYRDGGTTMHVIEGVGDPERITDSILAALRR